MKQDSIVIVAARRTPIGTFQGSLSAVKATDLSATATRAALADCGVDSASIDEVLMGCVLPAGLGQAPARQAALAAGLPLGVPCTTVNKVCGSGMKTVMLGADLIRADSARVVLAGGMESMSNAPYLMPKARSGYRMGHQEVLDHMFYDGLQSPFDGQMMGHFAEQTASKYGFTRKQQDAFAVESVTRAANAANTGAFANEIAAVTVKSRKGETVVSSDEGPGAINVDKIPTLRPAFAADGTVTAASSSSISDGAASLILMRDSDAEKAGIKPLVRIVGHSSYAQEPEWFTTSPVFAIKALHKKLGWSPESVDLYEINEAFACVTMAAMHDVGIPHEKVNVHGGACALGHPIGASGARLIVTLIHALQKRGGGRGIASLCIGGGEAVAIGIEA
ncbi:acetyl-CoA C-acyltransferase [Woeseia oceani]|uniref:Acetyl-CoA acetyltransferase n=1 Tax=Woeseia oceani TaxID=1548547 RepID=A0A193LEI4_9GAMM|nr:acetyl-CoA C-acyltransferase [Woeseia oceani]ANO50794.1 acetyl-CoA acetyltransferase [Woeseia oceani]